jgi:abhydrolase domain-containing protein 12
MGNANGSAVETKKDSDTISVRSNSLRLLSSREKSRRGNSSLFEESRQYPIKLLRDGCSQTEGPSTNLKKYGSCGNFFITAMLAYFGVCVVVCLSSYLQSRLLYLSFVKSPFEDLTQLEQYGLSNARNINITTEDGLLLRGWHIAAANINICRTSSDLLLQDDACFDRAAARSDRIVLFLHGNAGTRGKSHRLEAMKQLSAYLHADVVTFDYRGFGDSEGYPSEFGTHLDARAMIRWIRQILDRSNSELLGYSDQAIRQPSAHSYNQSRFPFLYIYGHSLGSAVAAALAHEITLTYPEAIRGLILDAPFTSVKDIALTMPVLLPFRVFPVVKQFM